MARKSLETDKQKDRRVRCAYCDKPIHIDNWAGVGRRGFICGNSVCLMELAQEMEERKMILEKIEENDCMKEVYIKAIGYTPQHLTECLTCDDDHKRQCPDYVPMGRYMHKENGE